MSELCIDASVVVKLVLAGESHRAAARRLLRDCVVNSVALIAPPFFEVETDTVIRKRVYDGRLSLADARKAFVGLGKTRVQICTPPRLRWRTREIAEQFNLRTVYDASYAALADLRGCEFWTADKVFYNSVKAGLTFVRYLPDYPGRPTQSLPEQIRVGTYS
jgi:predicted nucleic acid-binding protein